jgi:hypothetical protein
MLNNGDWIDPPPLRPDPPLEWWKRDNEPMGGIRKANGPCGTVYNKSKYTGHVAGI